jgi:hypothetical protein
VIKWVCRIGVGTMGQLHTVLPEGGGRSTRAYLLRSLPSRITLQYTSRGTCRVKESSQYTVQKGLGRSTRDRGGGVVRRPVTALHGHREGLSFVCLLYLGEAAQTCPAFLWWTRTLEEFSVQVFGGLVSDVGEA